MIAGIASITRGKIGPQWLKNQAHQAYVRKIWDYPHGWQTKSDPGCISKDTRLKNRRYRRKLFTIMEKKIETIKNFRLFLLNQINDLTDEQLNKVPAGYNNNIVWNLGHLICAEQNICYVKAGLPIIVDDKYFSPYLPNTKPEAFVNGAEIAVIKKLFISTIETLQTDFARKIFVNYSPAVVIKKTYGVEVNNIDDALEYLLYHEGFHAGYITSIKHLV